MVFKAILQKVFGSRNDRVLKTLNKRVIKINLLEEAISKLSDEELKGKTAEFKARLAKDEAPDSLLEETEYV